MNIIQEYQKKLPNLKGKTLQQAKSEIRVKRNANISAEGFSE